MNAPDASRRVALVMGVANHRSIAWACVQEFLRHRTDCILTCHPRFARHVDRLVQDSSTSSTQGRILGHVSCEVETGLPNLFQHQLPELLGDRKLDTVLHSIAFADMENTKSLGNATWEAYAQAQHISSYSLIETVRCASALLSNDASVTALTYLGAVRALRPYHVMGPAKAALEANVRGLAAECGSFTDTNGTSRSVRVNAVSAGPVATLSARGIPDFGQWSRQVAHTSPLQRNVTTQEIASTVHFLSTATGITGQTIYVDAGYSAVIPLYPS